MTQKQQLREVARTELKEAGSDWVSATRNVISKTKKWIIAEIAALDDATDEVVTDV